MIFTTQTTYNLFFASMLFACFLGDLGQFFLKGAIIIPFLLCIYCTLLLDTTHPHGWRMHLFIIALLQCLEYFCFYNFFLLANIFLIPTTIIALILKKHLYPSIANIITLTLISSFIQIYGAEGYILATWPTIPYTIMRISATLLTTISFSLTIKIWGMQDNRA